MNYFLDTNTCIDALRGTHPHIQERMRRLDPGRIKIPSLVLAELLLGAAKSSRARQASAAAGTFLAPFEVVPFCAECALAYAKIRKALEEAGRVIGPNDLVIAATVLAHRGTLVTHHTREYSRVHGLHVEDWTA